MLNIIKNFVLDTLFPISCLSCGLPNIWICQNCLNKIEILSVQACPYCEKTETPRGAVCPRCKTESIRKNKPLPLDNLIVTTKYSQRNVSQLVHIFKYNFIRDLGLPLASLTVKAVLDSRLPLPDFIVPVPLHPRRLRWRGFNQAEVLAEILAENVTPGLPILLVKDLILRKKFTPPQMKIKSYQARKENMRNSFGLQKKFTPENFSLRNKKILLVDDISTTGSTILECAKILKAAGAKKVYGVVIARQEIL